MGLSDPRGIYGVHSVTPYDRITGLFYGTVKVVDGSSLNIEGTTNELTGGSSKFPWAVEDGDMKCELNIKAGEYPNFFFELFYGNAPTVNAAEANGATSALTAKKGALIGTTGIASVGLDAPTKSSLKFAKFVVVAVSPTTVDVFASSDADFGRGTSLSFQNDLLKINPTPLTITSAVATVIPGTGVALTGGAGTIAMVTGDTAAFETRPVNSGSMSVKVGGASKQTMPEFGALIMAQKRGNDEFFEIDCFRCKGSGMPIGFEANSWAKVDIKAKVFYDSAKDGVFEVRAVQAQR